MNKFRKYGSVKIIKRIKKFSLKDGLKILSGDKKIKYNVKTNEDRYKCFLLKGHSCYMCKLKASYFALEYVKSSSYEGFSLNLYSNKKEKEEYFTKDHIIPKSLGGPNDISNYNTMCWACNSKKGSRII